MHPEPLFNWVFGTALDAWQRRTWSLAVVVVGLAAALVGLRWAERPVRERPS